MDFLDHYFAERLLSYVDGGSKEALAYLMAHTREGHLSLPIDRTPCEIQKGLSALVIFDEGAYYFPKSHTQETKIAEHIKRLLASPLEPLTCPEISGVNAQQLAAIKRVSTSAVTLIAGGPGTGKSYTACKIVEAFPSKRITAAAPTGKAAMRLPQHIQSGTLHALFRPHEEPLPFFPADLLLIDECSMIDAGLFAHLLASVRSGCRLVLFGDPDQLPAIESGSIFADLLQCPQIPSVHLQECIRSEATSVLTLAHAIKKGDLAEVARFTKPLSSFSLDSRFCLLSSLREGPYGVNAMNQKIRSARTSRDPEPIMITSNDYDLKLFNGQVGVLRDQVAYFQGMPPLPLCRLPAFEFAYCLSVHKSQGSEYERVALLLPPGSENFGRELLYTAVTRAKQEVALYAASGVLEAMLKKSSRKYSQLTKRICDK